MHAQEDRRLSFDFRDVELREALSTLETAYELTFSFSDDLIAGQRVTRRVREVSLEEAMAALLKNTRIDFRLVQDQYVLLLTKADEEAMGEAAPDSEPGLISYQLRGRVVDGESGQGLPFARWQLEATGIGGYTDEEGQYEMVLEALPEDVLKIWSLGYAERRFAVSELAGSNRRIAMSWSSVGLADVVVTAYLTDGIDLGDEVGQIRFSPEKIDVLPGQAEPDILQGLLLLPGVTSSSESVSDINIRGGTADQNLVLWDGIPIYHTGHYFGSFTAFNPFIVDQVDVWRGGFGAEYGGRVAGVIDIRTRNDIGEEIRAGAGLNLTHGHIFGEIPIIKNKLSAMVSVRRSFTDIFRTITFRQFQNKIFQGTKLDENEGVINEEVLVESDEFFFLDANLKLLWQPSERDKFSFSYFTGSNKLEFTLAEPSTRLTDLLDILNWGAKLDWNHRWSAEWSAGLQGSYSYFDYGAGFIEDGTTGARLITSENLNTLSDRRLSATFNWAPEPEHRLRFGADWMNYDLSFSLKYSSVFEPDFMETNQPSTDVYGAFADYRFQDEQDRWTAQLGLRSVYVSNLDTYYWEPRLNLSYKPTDNLRIKANGGINHQFINQLIEFDFNGIGVDNQIWTLVDGEEFPALRSTQFAFGLDWADNGWFVDVEGYYRRLRGITSFAPAFATVDSGDFNEGQGRSYGVDFLLRKRWGNHQSWISYSWSHAENFFDHLSSDWFPAFNDQRHRFSWVYLWQQERFSLSVGWNVQTGRPFSPVVDIELEEFEDDAGLFTLASAVLGDINSRSLPTYHRLDMSGLYKFSGGQRTEFQVGFSIINVYRQENVFDRNFRDVAFEEGEEVMEVVETFERNLLPFTPNLFFRLEWQ